MEMLSQQHQHCPYCGEPIDFLVDGSVSQQEYIEDCQVCCRPIIVTVTVHEDTSVEVQVRREDD